MCRELEMECLLIILSWCCCRLWGNKSENWRRLRTYWLNEECLAFSEQTAGKKFQGDASDQKMLEIVMTR
ncbi:hypothetical protein ACS0TY_024711 [Phlomoides rotata]